MLDCSRYWRYCCQVVRVSRPGCYQFTLWLYFLPTGRRPDLLSSPIFYIGAMYCTLPMNLLLYVMNDYMDTASDAANPRKGGWFGARYTRSDLQHVAVAAVLLQVPFLFGALMLRGYSVFALYFAFLFLNTWYNFFHGSRTPPFDLLLPLGYTLVIPLSAVLNATPSVPVRTMLHALLGVLRLQVLTQVADIAADASVGRRTSAVALGPDGSLVLLTAVTAAELQLHLHAFANVWLVAYSAVNVLVVVAMATGKRSMGKFLTPLGLCLWIVSGVVGWRDGSFVN